VTQPEGWTSIRVTETAASMETELQKELGSDHPLFGKRCQAVAVNQDDVLIELIDEGCVAEVHLTWAGHSERPPWPVATVFRSYAAWLDDVKSR